ncbi:hypothetical protein IWQ60_006473 [Tieghemiomyces parasiticus]|uniref:Uncharacterized protein n=1 Tax=Tieghemiomyces parasiticus TaxID=78921 RepID=A0A9W8DS53_9FUNG|nr:hypothetical protein IWQ60_006473 [Tieghemiomyces parasiticus]
MQFAVAFLAILGAASAAPAPSLVGGSLSTFADTNNFNTEAPFNRPQLRGDHSEYDSDIEHLMRSPGPSRDFDYDYLMDETDQGFGPTIDSSSRKRSRDEADKYPEAQKLLRKVFDRTLSPSADKRNTYNYNGQGIPMFNPDGEYNSEIFDGLQDNDYSPQTFGTDELVGSPLPMSEEESGRSGARVGYRTQWKNSPDSQTSSEDRTSTGLLF